MNKMEQIYIRQVQRSDIPAIMQLIQLKAQFDGCLEVVEASPKKLEADLFRENPLAFVLLAEVDQNPIGFATYHFIYSTFLTKPGI